jgi:hypothetical protein
VTGKNDWQEQKSRPRAEREPGNPWERGPAALNGVETKRKMVTGATGWEPDTATAKLKRGMDLAQNHEAGSKTDRRAHLTDRAKDDRQLSKGPGVKRAPAGRENENRSTGPTTTFT